MERRTFLKTAGLGTAGAILGVQHLSAMNPSDSPAPKKGAKVRLAAIGIGIIIFQLMCVKVPIIDR